VLIIAPPMYGTEMPFTFPKSGMVTPIVAPLISGTVTLIVAPPMSGKFTLIVGH
jgi:transcription termination factor Rho